MLNLFKLPFWGNKNNEQDLFPANNIAHGIFRNYISRAEKGLEGKGLKASQYIDDEFKSLQQSLEESLPEGRYDLIRNALMQIDQKLGDL